MRNKMYFVKYNKATKVQCRYLQTTQNGDQWWETQSMYIGHLYKTAVFKTMVHNIQNDLMHINSHSVHF